MSTSNTLLLIAIGFAPSIIWLVLFLKKDPKPEPKYLIIRVFLFGIIIAITSTISSRKEEQARIQKERERIQKQKEFDAKLKAAAQAALKKMREDALKSERGRIGYEGFKLYCEDHNLSEVEGMKKLMEIELAFPGSIEKILYPYCLKAAEK